MSTTGSIHSNNNNSALGSNNSNTGGGGNIASADDTKTEVSLSSSVGWAGSYSKKMMALNWDYTCGPLRVVQVGPHNHHWARLHAPGHAVLPKADGTLQHFKEQHRHTTDAELMRQVLLSGVSKAKRDPKEKLLEPTKPRDVDFDFLKQRLTAQSVPLPPARPSVNVYDPRSRQPPVYDDASTIFSVSTASNSVRARRESGAGGGASGLLSSSRLHLPPPTKSGIGSSGRPNAAAGAATAADDARSSCSGASSNVTRSRSSVAAASPAASAAASGLMRNKSSNNQQHQRPPSRQEQAATAALDAVRSETGSVKSELARARRTLDSIERAIESHSSMHRPSYKSTTAADVGSAPPVVYSPTTAAALRKEDVQDEILAAHKKERESANATIEAIQKGERFENHIGGGGPAAMKAAKPKKKNSNSTLSAAGEQAATPTAAGTDSYVGSSQMAARREIANSLTISRRALTPWC